MFLRTSLLVTFVAIGVVAIGACQAKLIDYVNPYIGTGGAGWGTSQIPPGPQMPFAAMRLSPDTSFGWEPIRIGFYEGSGYYYPDNYIECFSHTHVDGAGCTDWQNFGVTVTRSLDASTVKNAGYRSKYSHDRETMKVGYYAVDLLTPNVKAEITTCGNFAGMHRYSALPENYSSSSAPYFLVVDICHAAVVQGDMWNFAKACVSASIISFEPTSTNNNTYRLQAKMFNSNAFESGRQPRDSIEIFFVADVTVTGAASTRPYYWNNFSVFDGAPSTGAHTTTSQSMGVAIEATPAAGATVQFTVSAALSFVNETLAIANLQNELAGQTFDSCRAINEATWETVLSNAMVGDAAEIAQTDRDRLTVFYTGLYHGHHGPTTYSEADGLYRGLDGLVHRWPAGQRYVSDLSLWDTYRTHHPMLILLQPEVARDVVNSMVNMYNVTGGNFPQWPMASIESGVMVGHHGVVMAGDAIQKMVPGLDLNVTFNTIIAAVTRQNADNLSPLNYVPIERSGRSAGVTLDYAVDAGAVYNVAKWLGRSDIMAQFNTSRFAFQELWSTSEQALCGKFANGTLQCEGLEFPFYPLNNYWVEGDGAQYRWYVPAALDELIGLFESRDRAASALHKFFADAMLWPFNTTLPNPFFWAGNEPSFLTPVIFNWMGNEYAHLTQSWFPRLLDTYFFNGPAGVPGNDDYGAESSWSVFGYLGLYPAASTTTYALFVPQFDNVTLRAGSSGRSTIRLQAHGRTSVRRTGSTNSSATNFLANASLNGVALPTPFVTHDALLKAAATAADGVAVVDFFLAPEATVFGEPAPSSGGPKPWMPKALSATQEQQRRNQLTQIAEKAAGMIAKSTKQQGAARRHRRHRRG